MNTRANRRILVVDDNESIQTDYRKILGAVGARDANGLSDLESDLFGEDEASLQSTVEPYEISSETLRLRPNDTLVLYTDGITEAMNAGTG